MNKVTWLKDLLENKMHRQRFFNDNMLYLTNPEARQTFAQIRDDEMRHIIILQQIIDTLTHPKQPVSISPFK
jgi:rubrerythrin